MGEILLKEDMTEQEYVKWLLSLKHKKTGKQRFSAEQARSHAKERYAPKKPERKSATAETELYRLLSKKQYKTMLAKNDLTLQQVQKVLKNVISKVKKQIKVNASPRHVPDKILPVLDIPRTKNGKIVELAVRNIIEGDEIKNKEALANPEVLVQYKNLKELKN